MYDIIYVENTIDNAVAAMTQRLQSEGLIPRKTTSDTASGILTQDRVRIYLDKLEEARLRGDGVEVNRETLESIQEIKKC